MAGRISISIPPLHYAFSLGYRSSFFYIELLHNFYTIWPTLRIDNCGVSVVSQSVIESRKRYIAQCSRRYFNRVVKDGNSELSVFCGWSCVIIDDSMYKYQFAIARHSKIGVAWWRMQLMLHLCRKLIRGGALVRVLILLAIFNFQKVAGGFSVAFAKFPYPQKTSFIFVSGNCNLGEKVKTFCKIHAGYSLGRNSTTHNKTVHISRENNDTFSSQYTICNISVLVAVRSRHSHGATLPTRNFCALMPI